MSLGPYFSPFFDVPEMDDEQRALDAAMRKLHTAISDAMDRDQRGEKRRHRIEFACMVALAVFVLAFLVTVALLVAGVLA